GTPDIKVITGVRRSGKSKLLEAFKRYVTDHVENANIIHINFNLPDFDELTEYRPLYDYINAAYKEGVDNFVQVIVSVYQFHKQSCSFIIIIPHLFPEIKYFKFLGNRKRKE
ncbi:MAG: AAA family ATPase, partial [Firmicutes bacterium]|nr:AAA family ATPase [Bacillota bacterium]